MISHCEHPLITTSSTGATGYIGGDALHAIVDAHPEYELACLVRDSNKGGQVASQFARARLVYGNLDNLEILEEEAKKANIVLSTCARHQIGCSRVYC